MMISPRAARMAAFSPAEAILSGLSITRIGRTIRLYKSKIWRVPSSLIPSAISTSIFMSPKACRQRESRQLRMCLRSLRQATITDTRMFSLACMFGFYFPRDRELSEAIPALKESAWRHIPLAPAAEAAPHKACHYRPALKKRETITPHRMREFLFRLESDSRMLREGSVRRRGCVSCARPHAIPLADAYEGDPDRQGDRWQLFPIQRHRAKAVHADRDTPCKKQRTVHLKFRIPVQRYCPGNKLIDRREQQCEAAESQLDPDRHVGVVSTPFAADVAQVDPFLAKSMAKVKIAFDRLDRHVPSVESMAETFAGGDINLRSAINQFAVSCAHVSKNGNANHQENQRRLPAAR